MVERVINVLKNFTAMPQENINADSMLIADLGMDSLKMIEAVVAVEKEFNVHISDKKLFGMRTVNDVAKVIEELQN